MVGLIIEGVRLGKMKAKIKKTGRDRAKKYESENKEWDLSHILKIANSRT